MIRSRSRSKSKTPSRKISTSCDVNEPKVSPLKLCLRNLKDDEIRAPSSSSESIPGLFDKIHGIKVSGLLCLYIEQYQFVVMGPSFSQEMNSNSFPVCYPRV